MDFTKLENALIKAKDLDQLATARQNIAAAVKQEREKQERAMQAINNLMQYLNSKEQSLMNLHELRKIDLIPMPTEQDEKQ
jgi:DNA-binding protein H-NS